MFGFTEEQIRLRESMEILADYDVIVDGSDNFPAKYLANDACVLLGKAGWEYKE